jgi:hypothetical protein
MVPDQICGDSIVQYCESLCPLQPWIAIQLRISRRRCLGVDQGAAFGVFFG